VLERRDPLDVGDTHRRRLPGRGPRRVARFPTRKWTLTANSAVRPRATILEGAREPAHNRVLPSTSTRAISGGPGWGRHSLMCGHKSAALALRRLRRPDTERARDGKHTSTTRSGTPHISTLVSGVHRLRPRRFARILSANEGLQIAVQNAPPRPPAEAFVLVRRPRDRETESRGVLRRCPDRAHAFGRCFVVGRSYPPRRFATALPSRRLEAGATWRIPSCRTLFAARP
jgi:hypothetical protein